MAETYNDDQIAGLVYDKLSSGEPISDHELDVALAFFHSLSENLMLIGPVFELAAKEAHRAYSLLKSFSDARSES